MDGQLIPSDAGCFLACSGCLQLSHRRETFANAVWASISDAWSWLSIGKCRGSRQEPLRL